ncbi:unnamed protein product [Peniophora sp. CBMAI 1063]|nr:unnamed protein product [Peniophora sp. CBMAI 1063]
MFPITCNAIGDIIAVVQLIRDIVVALDDARGAAEEYKQFTRVLSALGTVMGEVYDLAKASCNEILKQAVLEEVQLCCIDINNAHKSISGYGKLEKIAARSTRNTTRGVFLKLQWHLLRASDAAKYAQRFDDSHQRLNSFISLLGHQSTSHLLEEQQLQLRALQVQSRALRESTKKIGDVALSALGQVSSMSRQQIVEQTISRPFFAVPHDRRVASRVRRVADMIFDSLAPDTPRDRRDRFLSLLAPFFVAGAAFVVHNNVGLQWQATGLWSAICALVAQVLWLQSSTPMHPGFGLENGVLLIGLLGEEITVPSHFCSSYEYFHGFLCLFYSKIPGAVDFVPCKRYELYKAGTSWLVSEDNWTACMRPGICIEMGLLHIYYFQSDGPKCPYCDWEYSTRSESHEVVCTGCAKKFRQTRVNLELVRLAGVGAIASIFARLRGTDWRSAFSQINLPISTLTTSAQYLSYVDIDEALSFTRRCRRLHVVSQQTIYDYAPEQMQLVSQQVVDALIANQDIFSRSTLVYELFRARIWSTSDWNAEDTMYEKHLRAETSVYNAALEELERGTILGGTHKSAPFDQPMTVVQQLLAQMVSTLDAFIEQPSEEGVCQWEDIVKGHSGEYLSLDERNAFQELVTEHGTISQDFKTVFGFAGRSP